MDNFILGLIYYDTLHKTTDKRRNTSHSSQDKKVYTSFLEEKGSLECSHSRGFVTFAVLLAPLPPESI